MSPDGKDLYCQKHGSEMGSAAMCQSILDFIHEFKEKVTKLETEIIQLQCVASYTKIPGLGDDIKMTLKDIYTEIQEKFCELMNYLEKITVDSKFEDFTKI